MKSDDPPLNNSTFIPDSKYIYKIQPLYSKNLVFEVEKGKIKDGTNIQLGESKDEKYQYFKILSRSDNCCRFEPLHCRTSVIDVKYSKMKNQTNIHLYTQNSSNAQYFKIITAGESCYSFLSSIDQNFCIDCNNSGTKPGTNIQLYKRNYTNAQKFRLIPRRDISLSVEYAKKYALEKNKDFKNYNPNNVNFCSRCLVAGGVEENSLWNQNKESFSSYNGLKDYFINKGIKLIEYLNGVNIEQGDILFLKFSEQNIKVAFVVSIKDKQILICSNDPNMKEETIDKHFIWCILKTSSLFK